MRVPGPVGAETTFFDASERWRSEEILREAYEQEHEQGDLLRALDEMKNAFLRAVSHDMRTPLTAILSYAEVLQSAAGRATPDRLAAMAGDIAKGARVLDRLLTDLLDLDRLSRRTVEPSRRMCDVEALIQGVVERVGTASHPLSISASDVHAPVDPAQLERIVENLVVNALRHTPPGTPVEVVAVIRPEGLLVTVDGRGPGVPDELKARVFNAFERGNAPKELRGTGIGLSLVAKFAELHGGRAGSRIAAGAALRSGSFWGSAGEGARDEHRRLAATPNPSRGRPRHGSRRASPSYRVDARLRGRRRSVSEARQVLTWFRCVIPIPQLPYLGCASCGPIEEIFGAAPSGINEKPYAVSLRKGV